jgi:hypothetical protein
VRNVKELTTEEVREAWRNTLVPTGENTYEFVDPDVADTEFNLWLVTERHRVANLAIEKERKRIIANIMDRVQDLRSCHKQDNCQELGQLIESYIPEWTETNG